MAVAERLTKTTRVRLTETEYARLGELASAAGVSMNAVLRGLVIAAGPPDLRSLLVLAQGSIGAAITMVDANA